MKTTMRLAAVAVATVLAAGGFQVIASPAQAATIHGCGEQEACWYRYADFNHGGGPSHEVSVSWLRTHPGGVKMYYWDFNDKLTCVVNNSRGSLSTTLILVQHPDYSGMRWSVWSGGYAVCYDGTVYDNRASIVIPRPL
jgi:hypothetical protein